MFVLPNSVFLLLMKKFYFALPIVLVFLILPWIPLKKIPEPPEVISALPEFVLTNQDGKPFGSDNLKGKVYIASFIFTSCPTICPLITNRMLQLQAKFKESKLPIELVSFSVDPGNDSPSILKDYANKYHADTSSWNFLTGPQKDMLNLLEKGFMVPMGEKIPMKSQYDISHTQKLVLIDQKGNIRGYYSSQTEEGLDEIYNRAQHVLFLVK